MTLFQKLDASGPGYRLLVLALLGELNNASADEAAGFLEAMGRRIAIANPVGNSDTLPGLTAEINRLWNELDWGIVRLHADADAIHITHDEWPSAMPGDREKLWPEAFVMLVRSIYQTWFRQLGGDDLMTSLISRTPARLEFRHGR